MRLRFWHDNSIIYVIAFYDRLFKKGNKMKAINRFFAASLMSMMVVGTASADSIFIDTATDYNASGSTATTWFDSLGFIYNSETTVTDTDNSFQGDPADYISVGDATSTDVGLSIGTTLGDLLGSRANSLNGLAASFLGGDDNGFVDGQTNWAITFGITDLLGTVTSIDGGTIGLNYQTATLNMYLYDFNNLPGGATLATDISAGLVHLLDLEITTGGDTGNSTVLTGHGDNFTNGDIFNIAYQNSSITFEAASLLGSGLQFLISNDTQGTGTSFTNEGLLLTGSHEGSIEFSVPEPTSLAILGLGLLGFAGTRRRKA